MNVYFAAPIRGDRSKIETNKYIVNFIKERGHEVLTDHTVKEKEKLIEIENNFGSTNIYKRDMKWIDECDILIAEATAPSFGVGYEVGYMLGSEDLRNKKVIILFDRIIESQVSAMVTGNCDKNAIVYGYESVDDIGRFLRNYL